MVDYTNANGYQTDSSGRRQFVDRDDASGVEGTSLIADDRNQDRNSLVDLVKAAGLTPDGNNDTQVTQAVQYFCKQAASGAVLGSPGVLATGDVAGSVLYYSAALAVPAFTYGSTTVGLATTTALTSALGNYLPLGGGNVTGEMDWGDKTKSGTVTHRFWSAGPPATGDATPDVTLTVTGGTPGTANAGTFRLSTGTFDLSGSGSMLVPDVVDFTTQGALSARVAEGRYIRSVPNTGQARITDLVENADGRAVFGDGTNNPVLANLADLPLADSTQKIQAFTVVTPGVSSGGLNITFPRAFAPGTVPVVVMAGNMEGGGLGAARTYCFGNEQSATNTPIVNNEGFNLDQTYLTTNNIGWSSTPGTLHVIAVGAF